MQLVENTVPRGLPLVEIVEPATIRLISTAYIEEPAMAPLADTDAALAFLEEIERKTSLRQNEDMPLPSDVRQDELLTSAYRRMSSFRDGSNVQRVRPTGSYAPSSRKAGRRRPGRSSRQSPMRVDSTADGSFRHRAIGLFLVRGPCPLPVHRRFDRNPRSAGPRRTPHPRPFEPDRTGNSGAGKRKDRNRGGNTLRAHHGSPSARRRDQENT